jgi:predicted Zn-dependent protease
MAASISPRLSGPYVGLAQLARTRNDGQGEVAVLEQGLKAIPGDPWLSTMLAEVRHRRGDIDAAIADYEKILARNPTFDVAANNLAAILAERKRDKASLERALTLARRFEKSGNATFQDTLGWIYAQLGDSERAVTLLRSAVTAAPEDPAFQYHLGMALYKQGDHQAAKQHLQVAMNANVDFPGRDEAAGVLAKI